MKSKPQFALSSCYESVQRLLVRKSLHVCASVLLASTGRGPHFRAAHSTLQSSSKSLLRSPFFFFSLQFYKSFSSCFPCPFFQTIIIWVREENAAQKEKKKIPELCRRASLEDLAEHRSAQACEENNHSWGRKTSRRMRENSA